MNILFIKELAVDLHLIASTKYFLMKQHLFKTHILCLLLLFVVITSKGQNWEQLGPGSISTGPASYISMVVNNSTPYVIYQNNDNNGKATVKKLEDNKWITVGSEGFSIGTAYFTAIAFNGTTPYVVYQDGGNNYNITVKKFDGNEWIAVGAEGFSNGDYTSIAFNETTPYVAYRGSDGKANVKMFNGNNWITLGSVGFSTGNAEYIRIYLNEGIPYVVYRDGGNSNKAIVKKFDGNNWVTVGNAGFSAGSIFTPTMAFDGNMLYVIYSDYGKNNKAVVKTLSGSNWSSVGTEGFSAGEANYPSIILNGKTPYVAYQDYGNSGKATVKKYDGSDWVDVGNVGFSTGLAYYTSIALGANKLYVAYRDSGNGFAALAKQYTLPLNPLPVNLNSFTGLTKSFGNVLSFSTFNESNNKGFEIERKGNEGDFKKIGFVQAGTEYSHQQNYSFTDKAPLKGNNYYRLKQLDNDGKFTYTSSILHLKNSFLINKLITYPNPVKEQLTLSGIIGTNSIKIYNNLGKIVKYIPVVSTTMIIDISNFSNGIYHLSNGLQKGTFVKE